jgi:hypothetical protein
MPLCISYTSLRTQPPLEVPPLSLSLTENFEMPWLHFLGEILPNPDTSIQQDPINFVANASNSKSTQLRTPARDYSSYSDEEHQPMRQPSPSTIDSPLAPHNTLYESRATGIDSSVSSTVGYTSEPCFSLGHSRFDCPATALSLTVRSPPVYSTPTNSPHISPAYSPVPRTSSPFSAQTATR